LLGYAGLLVWEWASISAPYGRLDVFSFESIILLFALAPIAFLCLVPHLRNAMGILALLVIGLGIWLYDVNDGDPIGVLILIFYQYCAAAIGWMAVMFGARIIRAAP
jgi:hypothetical protein